MLIKKLINKIIFAQPPAFFSLNHFQFCRSASRAKFQSRRFRFRPLDLLLGLGLLSTARQRRQFRKKFENLLSHPRREFQARDTKELRRCLSLTRESRELPEAPLKVDRLA